MPYTEQNRGRGVCEVRATGAKNNSGYYDPTIAGAGFDYSQQDAAQVSFTDLTTPGAASTTLASVLGTWPQDCVGNAMNITSGTNFDVGTDNTSVYWITAVASDGKSVTLDRTPTGAGAGSVGVGTLGGARASVGGAMANQASGGGTKIYMKGGTYVSTSSTNNVDGGRFTPVAGSATNGPTLVIGYSTTRTDGATGTRPYVTFAFGAVFATMTAADCGVFNVDVQCSNTASSVGYNATGDALVCGCRVYQASTGFRGQNGFYAYCIADACGNGFGDGTSSINRAFRCWSKGATSAFGIRVSSGGQIIECMATGGVNHGFYTDTDVIFMRCTASGNAGAGFHRTNANLNKWTLYIDCLSTYNTTYGFQDAESVPGVVLVNCATVGNTTARSVGVFSDQGAITLAGDPYMDRANNDFRPNRRGPGIVVARGGFLNTYPGNTGSIQNAYVGGIPSTETTLVSDWPNHAGWPNNG